MRLPTIVLCTALAFLVGCKSTPEGTEAGGYRKVDAAGAGMGAGAGSGAVDQSMGGGAGSVGVTGRDLAGLSGSAMQAEFAKVGDRVYFGFDSYALTPEARLTIEQQASLLARNQSIAVTIEGHADERGTREYNLALGDRRANAVKDYLITLGVDPGRINTLSFGEERPKSLGSNDTAWARNRRAATVVSGGRVGS